ncbi:hypothetical protein [Sphaerisporangium sp. TRM90804]|uniref:hypothetical protein n=1 Tax=Sphaerisporangium sp. TRM90804 TaxID=3031113 RepID=UPI002448268E|nr:hypothetical protein [Sphaerisporangium sp. TRM90804]MDH2425789.1 hypothetical protein [Sphaerisporangium sp. TRM90804]
MVFPATPLDVLVELQLAGTWTDVTADVLIRDGGITITRGRQDEGEEVDPGEGEISFNNRLGKYSPRNPSSVYYGVLGRNTPVRVSVLYGPTYLGLPGAVTDYVSTPDVAALDITGDIDVRIDATVASWRTAADLAGKYVTSGNQRSWALSLTDAGILQLRWSATGSATVITIASTVPVPAPSTRRRAVRATLDVNNGAAGNTVTFYTAATIAGPWTQLGDPVITAGTTAIFASTAALSVGDVADLAAAAVYGQVHAFELRNGIAGSVVANPDFTIQTAGAASFADAAGRTWTLAGSAALTTRRVRFCGEISSWPSRWDVSGNDVWVPVQAAGIQRRLGQGASPLNSVLRRELTAPANTGSVLGYWPLEDEDGATSLASGVGGGTAMAITGAPDLAAFEGFTGSLPIPTWAGTAIGRLQPYTPTAQTQVRFLLAVPAGGAIGGQVLVRVWCSGSAVRWDVVYGTGGTLALKSYNRDGDLLSDSGTVTFAVDGKLLRCSVELTETGADVAWQIVTLEVGASTGSAFSGTLTTDTVGRVTSVRIAPDQGLSTTAIGHLSVHSAITSIFDGAPALRAWVGETAGARVKRLCAEEGIAFTPVGELSTTAAMGPQLPETLLDLMEEAAGADAGILLESRDRIGLGFRTRSSLYDQDAALVLDYTAGHVAPPFEPVDDDAGVRNDITIQRAGGSSSRAVQSTGPVSTSAPPAGVGRYEESVTINVASDDQLDSQAGWRLHLGTWDEARYPLVSVNLLRNPALIETVVLLDTGDRVTIANPPAWLPPETIDLMAQGYTETLTSYGWDLTFNCSPAGPYRVLQLNHTTYGRTDSLYSTLNAGLSTTATSLTVAVAAGRALWTTAAGDMPFDIVIGGEAMRVTAISGTSSPQTFTVTRSVNGVVKTHLAGAQVRLRYPVVFAL